MRPTEDMFYEVVMSCDVVLRISFDFVAVCLEELMHVKYHNFYLNCSDPGGIDSFEQWHCM